MYLSFNIILWFMETRKITKEMTDFAAQITNMATGKDLPTVITGTWLAVSGMHLIMLTQCNNEAEILDLMNVGNEFAKERMLEFYRFKVQGK